MLEECTLQPPHPHKGLNQRQPRTLSPKLKYRKPIHPFFRIAHPLHIPNPVVIEERLRPLRRPQMHKHRPHPTPIQLPPKIGHITNRLPAKRTPKVPQKYQQHRRSLSQRQQIRPRLRLNRSQRPRNIIRSTAIHAYTCNNPS